MNVAEVMSCQITKETIKDSAEARVVPVEESFIAFWQDGLWFYVTDDPLATNTNPCYHPLTNQEELP